MNRQERAKQFMPFASLRGYFDMILEKQKIKEEKKELLDYEVEKISWQLSKIKKGTLLTISYYQTDSYQTITGMVSSIDPVSKTLTLVKTLIPFEDILSINGEGLDLDPSTEL